MSKHLQSAELKPKQTCKKSKKTKEAREELFVRPLEVPMTFYEFRDRLLYQSSVVSATVTEESTKEEIKKFRWWYRFFRLFLVIIYIAMKRFIVVFRRYGRRRYTRTSDFTNKKREGPKRHNKEAGQTKPSSVTGKIYE